MRACRPHSSRARGARGATTLLALLVAGLACEDKNAPIERLAAAARAAPVHVTVTAAQAAPRAEPAAEPTCGLAGMPECPLQRWMDHHLSGPLSREEYPDVARAFRDLAAVAPTGFGGWSSWAQGGAAAAEQRDSTAIHKACNGCHDGYRERYRKTMRDRPVKPSDPP